MRKFFPAIIAILVVPMALKAQTTDLVFFSDEGQKFTLLVDGDQKNAEPAARVVATGIRNESPVVIIRFADRSIADVKKPGYFPLGKEYTVMITKNKKGEYVLRPTGEAELGTAAKAEPARPDPSSFREDPAPASKPAQTTTLQTGTVAGQQTMTTTTTITEQSGTTDNVTINMGVPGINMNMNVTGMPVTGTTTTTTTTTHSTTTTTGGSVDVVEVEEAPARTTRPPVPAYRMPGYTGPVGCPVPMSATEFEEARKSITSKGFEETKMTTAKQIGRDRCFTADQVKGIMQLFGFEDSKLDFAKFAYDRTYDIGNYYKVNDAFGFESSIEELDTYIKSR
ncbi:MAG: DUF4476 domain-containing protein [Flavobacteriales bacterium]|nr:DUF4476 domain-containing protein [Flavobacteriales bacterium]